MIVRGTYQFIDFYYIFQYSPRTYPPLAALYRGGYPIILNPLWFYELGFHWQDVLDVDDDVREEIEMTESDIVNEDEEDEEDEFMYFWEDMNEWDIDEFEEEEDDD